MEGLCAAIPWSILNILLVLVSGLAVQEKSAREPSTVAPSLQTVQSRACTQLLKWYSYGDSHSNEGMQELFQILLPQYAKVHGPINLKYMSRWLGAKTMHRVGRDGLGFLNIARDRTVSKCDLMAFSFGEIDLRAHVLKFGLQNSIQTIRVLADGYEQTLSKNHAHLSQSAFVLWSITPPVNIETLRPRNPNMPPVLGSNYQRVIFTLALNSMLWTRAKRNNWTYIDRFHDYADDRGLLILELSDISVHIKSYLPSTVAAVYNAISRQCHSCQL